jgi:hypothetical protein
MHGRITPDWLERFKDMLEHFGYIGDPVPPDLLNKGWIAKIKVLELQRSIQEIKSLQEQLKLEQKILETKVEALMEQYDIK